MKSEIEAKMEEHIRQILEKPSISNEDYELLRRKLTELPADICDGSGALNWAVPILAMLFSGLGGAKK